MKDYMVHVAAVLSIMAMAFTVSYLITNQTAQLYDLREEVTTLSKKNDSLKTELFLSERELERYQTTLNWFHTEYPGYAVQFEQVLSKNN